MFASGAAHEEQSNQGKSNPSPAEILPAGRKVTTLRNKNRRFRNCATHSGPCAPGFSDSNTRALEAEALLPKIASLGVQILTEATRQAL
jgi:hypothetical protein